MKMLSLSAMPNVVSLKFFRVSPIRYCLQFLIYVGLLALIGFFWWGDAPYFLVVPLGLLCLYGIFSTVKKLGRSVRTQNWLLAMDARKLYINSRPFIRFPRHTNEPKVIELQFSDIESVGMVTQSDLSVKHQYLEIRLRSPISKEIIQTLFDEHKQLAKKTPAAEISLKAPSQKCSVFVCGNNSLRVDVEDITTQLKEVMDILEEHQVQVTIKEAEVVNKKGELLHSKPQPQSKSQQSSLKKSRLLFCRIIPLVFILVGGISLYSGIRTLYPSVASLRWPTTEGRIVSSSVVERYVSSKRPGGAGPRGTPRRTGGISYQPEVVYEFSVDGKSYSNSRVDFMTWRSGRGRSYAHEIVDRYPEDSSVKVHYAPTNPTDSVLEPGPTAGNYLSFLIAYLMLIPGVSMAVFWPRRFYEDCRI